MGIHCFISFLCSLKKNLNMFEIYAFVASVLVPVGLISVAYVIYWSKGSENAIGWGKICNGTSTILLGIFYLYSAIVLSKKVPVNKFIENNIDDLAIINDTSYVDTGVPAFYPETENEIEDTRESKIKNFQQDFLISYHNLVQMALKKRLQNSTKEKLRSFRKLELEEDYYSIVEKEDCFKILFFYHALLVYSFISCVISLVITCQSISPETVINENKEDTPTEKASSSNFDPFVVKTTPTTSTPTTENKKDPKKSTLITQGLITILLPQILIAILYFIVNLNENGSHVDLDNFPFDVFSNFNFTRSDAQTDGFVKNIFKQNNSVQSNETENILLRVYDVIDKFKQNQKTKNAVKGQYLFITPFLNNTISNSTTNCLKENTFLKAYDFLTFILVFFVAVFFSKLLQVKNQNCKSLNNCILVFVCFWTPSIVDLIVKMFLAKMQFNLVSGLLLMFGAMNRVYFNFRDYNNLKKDGKKSQSIRPEI